MMELEKREKERLIRERIDAISNYVGEKEKKKKEKEQKGWSFAFYRGKKFE